MHFFFLRQFVPLPSSKGRSDLLDLKTKRLDLPVRIRSVEEGLCYSRTIESLLVNPFRFFYSFTSEHGSWFGYMYAGADPEQNESESIFVKINESESIFVKMDTKILE